MAGADTRPRIVKAAWYPSVSTISPPISSDATGPIREIDWYTPTSRPRVLGCEAASTTVKAPSRNVEKQAPQASRASSSGQNVGVSPYIAVVTTEPTPAATTGPRPPMRLKRVAATPLVTSRTIRLAPSSTPTDQSGK